MRFRTQILTLAGLGLALLGLLSQSLAAATVEETQQGLFIDTVDVNLVNVEVFVTDRKGNRIQGLTKDDFEVFENGRPVTITNFYAVEGGARVGAAPPPVAEPEEQPLRAAKPDVPEDQRLRLVVYIDNFNIQPFSRNRVMREVRDFLRQNLDSQDRVMLISYDRSLNIRHPFTRDPQLIAAALQELETVSGSAVHRESDRRDALERIQESETRSEAISFARTYSEAAYNDLMFSIDALRDVISDIAGLPGRKALLYVSEGLQMRVGDDLFQAIQQKFQDGGSVIGEVGNLDASRRFRELAATANANRVSFYTIDAGGLRTYSYADASNQTAGAGAFIDQIYVRNLQEPLIYLAEKTGGKSVINTNRVANDLVKIAGDFDTYYSIGYMPSSGGDGRYHRIEVKLKEKQRGIRVRHREGYRAKTPSVRMADSTISALLHAYQSNSMDLGMAFGPQKVTEKGHFQVPVMVRIPIGKVTLVPTDQSHEARLRLFVAVMDADGAMSEVQEEQVPISIPADQLEKAQKQDFLYGVQLLMRRGRHRVAVGIRDEVGADTSVILSNVDVGPR